jgi:hypothetical protein
LTHAVGIAAACTTLALAGQRPDGENAQALLEASANWQSVARRKQLSSRWSAWHAGHNRSNSLIGFGAEGTATFRAERDRNYTFKLLSCLDFDDEVNLAVNLF